MNALDDFSEPIELPHIPEGPGVCVILDAIGQVLQVAESINIRRRIGELLDSEGHIAVHGPKIYAAQRKGNRIFVRWKLTQDHKALKKSLLETLKPLWAE